MYHGYTGHEMLDAVGLIHMNGMLYDPMMARFLSADSHIQDPFNLQSFNRYSYVWNNPLSATDPSGYLSLFGHKILPGVFNNDNARVAVAIGLGIYTGGLIANSAWATGATWSGIAAGAAGGAVTGGIMGGSLQSAFSGAVSGAMFGWAGGVGAPTDMARYGAHALAGCASGELSGDGCGQGAFSAVAGKWATNATNGNFVASVVAGGTISVIGGGRFANGATTAAFGYLFNELSHASFNRKTGSLYVRDGDTGAEARGQFFSGTGSGDQITAGDYAILQRGDKDGFRLEPYDSVFGNDRNDATGQSLLRLHGPGRSNGCVTACDASGWAQVKALITNTSTTQVEVTQYKNITIRGGYLLGRIPVGTEKVNYYGRLKVE